MPAESLPPARVKNARSLPSRAADDSQITDHMGLDAARSRFGGNVIVGKDLLEI
jgi:hypothetical protein